MIIFRQQYSKHVAIPVSKVGRTPSRPMPDQFWCYLGPAALDSIRELLVGILEARSVVFRLYGQPWQLKGSLHEVGAKLWLSPMSDVTWLPELQIEKGTEDSPNAPKKSTFEKLWTFPKAFPRQDKGHGDVLLFIDPDHPSKSGGETCCNEWGGVMIEGSLEDPEQYGRLYLKLRARAMTGNDQETSEYESEKISFASLDADHFGGHQIEVGELGAIHLNINEGQFFFGTVKEVSPPPESLKSDKIPNNRLRATHITVEDEYGRSCSGNASEYHIAYKTKLGDFLPVERHLNTDDPVLVRK